MCIQGQQGATLQADKTENRHTTGSDVRSKTGRTQEVRGVACVQGKGWLLFVFVKFSPVSHKTTNISAFLHKYQRVGVNGKQL